MIEDRSKMIFGNDIQKFCYFLEDITSHSFREMTDREIEFLSSGKAYYGPSHHIYSSYDYCGFTDTFLYSVEYDGDKIRELLELKYWKDEFHERFSRESRSIVDFIRYGMQRNTSPGYITPFEYEAIRDSYYGKPSSDQE